MPVEGLLLQAAHHACWRLAAAGGEGAGQLTYTSSCIGPDQQILQPS